MQQQTKEYITMKRILELFHKYQDNIAAEGPEKCQILMNQIVDYLASRKSYHTDKAKIARNGGQWYDLRKQLKESFDALFSDSCNQPIRILFDNILFPAEFYDVANNIKDVYFENIYFMEKMFLKNGRKIDFPYISKDEFDSWFPNKNNNLIQSQVSNNLIPSQTYINRSDLANWLISRGICDAKDVDGIINDIQNNNK